MRKIQGIHHLMSYLNSAAFPLTEEEIHDLLTEKKLPHKNSASGVLIFDLDHIDWWINENQSKK
ncbi:hypothetical protein NLX67_17575 [Domibacillus sp. A3M-37]|uniref:hypothetical protein n=1 Tax=Domibacillus sp. A3M-37 TaxID=2962037 RepID=UPI0020B81171|nr:hypothetical protein [Domibacillus sp. A3M-37]MCP3764162.1 hypothetical protein [Domibacillus sp. A3M-37]